MTEQMKFPETFERFAKTYGFKDDEEVYTNGLDLITIFRVKQWLEHDNKLREIETDTAYECGKHANKWIPVSEKLPEVNQRVLVTSYGRVCYAMMTSVDGNSGYPIFRLQDSLNERVICETTVHSEFTTSRITAWMPLPESYKVDKEAEK